MSLSSLLSIGSFAFVCSGNAAIANAADDAAAEALLKDSKCLTVVGPSYKEVAAKYKDKPDAVTKLTKHLTEPSKVEVGGAKMDHGAIRPGIRPRSTIWCSVYCRVEDAMLAHVTSYEREQGKSVISMNTGSRL